MSRYNGKPYAQIVLRELMLPPPGLEASSPLNADPTTTVILAATAIASATMDLAAASSSIALALATKIPIVDAAKKQHDKQPEDNGKCELLGPFAILVQGSLGVLALLSLVFKRWRERPQRPVKIWAFDASKQVVGSVLVHVANLLMSLLSSGELSVAVTPADVVSRSVGLDGLMGLARRAVETQEKYKPNPCSFYLLNLAIDVS